MMGIDMPLKTLLLNPPSFENFDGGASSRWPATREIESYWYPVWLAYPAGMLEGSKLLDAPPHHVSAEETIEMAKGFEFLVLFTSTVGWAGDHGLARAIRNLIIRNWRTSATSTYNGRLASVCRQKQAHHTDNRRPMFPDGRICIIVSRSLRATTHTTTAASTIVQSSVLQFQRRTSTAGVECGVEKFCRCCATYADGSIV